jgi:hypothetical protein
MASWLHRGYLSTSVDGDTLMGGVNQLISHQSTICLSDQALATERCEVLERRALTRSLRRGIHVNLDKQLARDIADGVADVASDAICAVA